MNPTENPDAIREQIEAFGTAYAYDAGYLTRLLDDSPGAYETFTAAQAMSIYRDSLPLDAHFVARVATMQAADCGPCAQLNLRMAVEAGVDRTILRALIDEPNGLPEALRDVADHAREVITGAVTDPERAGRLRACYGDAAFAELAMAIVGSQIYPATKRALDDAGVCERLHLDF